MTPCHLAATTWARRYMRPTCQRPTVAWRVVGKPCPRVRGSPSVDIATQIQTGSERHNKGKRNNREGRLMVLDSSRMEAIQIGSSSNRFVECIVPCSRFGSDREGGRANHSAAQRRLVWHTPAQRRPGWHAAVQSGEQKEAAQTPSYGTLFGCWCQTHKSEQWVGVGERWSRRVHFVLNF
jgi:hypothetical protein